MQHPRARLLEPLGSPERNLVCPIKRTNLCFDWSRKRMGCQAVAVGLRRFVACRVDQFGSKCAARLPRAHCPAPEAGPRLRPSDAAPEFRGSDECRYLACGGVGRLWGMASQNKATSSTRPGSQPFAGADWMYWPSLTAQGTRAP